MIKTITMTIRRNVHIFYKCFIIFDSNKSIF